MAVIDELVTMLGFKIEPGALEKIRTMERGIQRVQGVAKAASIAVSGAVAGIGAAIMESSERAAGMEAMAAATRQSTDALQEWSYASAKVGADASAVQSDLAKMQKAFGGADIESLAKRFSGQLQGMGERQKQYFAQVQGWSMDFVRVLEQGPEALASMRSEAHAMGAIIPEDQIRSAAALNRGLKTLWATFRAVSDTVTMGAAPGFLKLVEAAQKWLAESRALIQQNLAGVLAGISSAFDLVGSAIEDVWNWFKKLLPDTEGLTETLFTFENAARFVRAGLVVLAVLLAPLIVKFALIAAAITAAVLVFDDLMAAFRGGDSVIGKLVTNGLDYLSERFPNLTKLVKSVADAFKALWDALDFGSVWDTLAAAAQIYLNVLGGILDKVDKLVGFGGDALSKVSGWFGGSKNSQAAAGMAQAAQAMAQPTTMSVPANSNHSGGTSDNRQTFNVTVNAASPEPGDIAAATTRALAQNPVPLVR